MYKQRGNNNNINHASRSYSDQKTAEYNFSQDTQRPVARRGRRGASMNARRQQSSDSTNQAPFEKFREYVEQKRVEATHKVERLTRPTATARKRKPLSSFRAGDQQDEPQFFERTKHAYEKYRAYIRTRLPAQAQRTQDSIAQRQQTEKSHERSTRRSQQEHQAQRGNLLLVLLVSVLIVAVAISIIQLVG